MQSDFELKDSVMLADGAPPTTPKIAREGGRTTRVSGSRASGLGFLARGVNQLDGGPDRDDSYYTDGTPQRSR